VNNVCKSAYYDVKALRHICKLLTDDATKTVACAMVAGRLDCCNAVLIGSSTSNIDKLQRVQNTLARVVSRRSRFDRATPLLADLHWLPVRYRIGYKPALITFKALTRQEPQYLAELIRMFEALRQLRPRGANILQCSPATLNFSRNAFCHAAPAVWNKLSETVTSDITVSIATLYFQV